jgi:hypothetical protein
MPQLSWGFGANAAELAFYPKSLRAEVAVEVAFPNPTLEIITNSRSNINLRLHCKQ